MLFGAEHVARYRATDGQEGHEWQGTHTLILTTTGARSGQERDAPLIYGREGDKLVVVASKGGAPTTRPGTRTCAPTRRCTSSCWPIASTPPPATRPPPNARSCGR